MGSPDLKNMAKKGWIGNEKMFQELTLVHPVRYVGSLPHRRSSGFVRREVENVEGFANLISMMDYVLDTKRKRHITGGFLLSAALLFGGLAMTVMSIRDEEIIEVEDMYNE